MDKAVTDYLEKVPNDRREIVDTLHTAIIELFPGIIVDMKYRMPTYQLGEGWVALANQKNYVSLYTCGYHHISAFKEKHPGIKTGKGCINLKKLDTAIVEDLKQVIEHAIQHPKVEST